MVDKIPEPLLQFSRGAVARGVEWLDKQAAHDMRFRGWRLQMISLIGGRVYSHVRLAYNTENPLSLALKWDSEFANSDGYVTWATVSRAFGFCDHGGHLQAVYLGFTEGDKKTLPEIDVECDEIYSYALDEVWREALGDYQTRVRPFVLELPPLGDPRNKRDRFKWFAWAFG